MSLSSGGLALEHLEEIGLDQIEGHAILVGVQLHVLLEVQVEVLEDKEELVVGVDDVQQLDDIQVVELLEQRDLANGRARHSVRLRVQPDALQGHHLARRVVLGLVDHAVHALANLLHPAEILNASHCHSLSTCCVSRLLVYSVSLAAMFYQSVNQKGIIFDSKAIK